VPNEKSMIFGARGGGFIVLLDECWKMYIKSE